MSNESPNMTPREVLNWLIHLHHGVGKWGRPLAKEWEAALAAGEKVLASPEEKN